MKIKGWMVHQRMVTPRPWVQKLRSRASASNERWAMDLTHIYCGMDGWGHLAALIDCHGREIVGFEFALRGRAKGAERALEQACLKRFGTLRPVEKTPVIRSDNGLVFQSRRFREACRFYRLKQEYITPYTPTTGALPAAAAYGAATAEGDSVGGKGPCQSVGQAQALQVHRARRRALGGPTRRRPAACFAGRAWQGRNDAAGPIEPDVSAHP
jgi:Integrase core domain